MAIVRTAGTEILRTVHLEDVPNVETNLIYGEQHHIYTVLSITVHCINLGAANDYIVCKVYGWDSYAGASGQYMNIFQQDMNIGQTFVWNDKFSFNGFEPLGSAMSGAITTSAEQNAIADQGGAVAQKLTIQGEASADRFDITCTYIDQNNA